MLTNDKFEDFESNIATDENIGNESINIVFDHAEDIDEEDNDGNITIRRQSAMSTLNIDLLDGRRSALSMISFVNREFDISWIGLIVWVLIVTIVFFLCFLGYNWWMVTRQSDTRNIDFAPIILHS